MRIRRPALVRRIASLVESTPPRLPVVIGQCGSGRTSLLADLRERFGADASQYVNLERGATTPEHFHRSLCLDSPFLAGDVPLTAATPRDAFDATLAFLTGARHASGAPAVFLLDEVLELRTFENFPGLRHLMRDLLAALTSSGNAFVLSARYTTRALRWLRDAGPRVEIVPMPPLAPTELRDPVAALDSVPPGTVDDTARMVHALADGHAGYAAALIAAMQSLGPRAGGDPIAALASLLEPGGLLAERIGWTYELRLHRARGYGALKGILAILAEEEPLTLTEIAQRLQRTPGSTKDYLSWLEDVDLITVRQKRYTFTDPLMRLWVRLHGRPSPPADDDVASEVHQYAMARLPQTEPAPALAMAGGPQDGDERKSWGIIEID